MDKKTLMPLSTLIKSGLSLLLSDSIPLSEEIIENSTKPLSVIKQHFTFTGYEITKAYQNSYGYAITAITVGLTAPEQKSAFVQKILNSKVTREFADPIELKYWQPFIQERDFSDEQCSDLRKQFINQLTILGKNKDNLFKINEIDENDLLALINNQSCSNVSNTLLEEMQKFTVDDTLAAFLTQNDLLGKAILYFFRDIIRQDDRVAQTKAALEQEGLIKSVQNIETAIEATQNKLDEAIASQSTQLTEIAQQLQNLQQVQSFTQFTQQFPDWPDLLNHQVEQLLNGVENLFKKLEEVHDDVKQTQEDVKKIEEMLSHIIHMGISPQIKARDEFTVHNDKSREWIKEAETLLKHLPKQNAEYSKMSIMVGSALSSTGTDALKKAELLFNQAIKNATNDDDKALAYFNLFQVKLRGKAYSEALEHLQAAIEINSEKFALHDFKKYPIQQLLGAGGMGCVLLCKNTDFLQKKAGHEQVVVKCFWESNKGKSEEEVFGEALSMQQIAGELVPKPLGYGYADSNNERAFFVSEYFEDAIDGELWLNKHGPLDLETGLRVALQIAKGLQLAHEAGIYHLDLKPANILLKKTETNEVSVKIIDFGLSQTAPSLRNEVVAQQNRTAGLSTFGQAIFGTLDYAPPEQRGYAEFGKPSAKSDIFAFGKTMYHLLTGEHPLAVEQWALKHAPEWYQLLSDCVIQKQEQRPSSAQEVIERLKVIEQAQNFKSDKKDSEQEELPKPSQTEGKRYIDNGDGTVKDNQTGLIWLKNANCFGTQNWKTAMQSAAKLADGQCNLTDGSKAGDWRLPTIEEWEAMMDNRYTYSALSNAVGTDQWKEGDAFLGVQTSNNYWSSSSGVARYSGFAWYVNLDNSSVSDGSKTSTAYVWPVRGGGQ